MKKENNPFKAILFINLFLVIVLICDTQSTNNVTTEIFDSIDTYKNYYSGYRSRGYESITILECANDHSFRIGNVPDEIYNLRKGDEIKIAKTSLFDKISLVGIKQQSTLKWYSVSFLSNLLIIVLLAFATLISIIHFFYNNTLMDVILALASVSIYFTFGMYYFYF